ncbi:hypothetical protein [Schlesneria sp. T3-172]|uniref:hypothetical protein n=1 Tax=Schlesneria sphaerica TaxID=3373610 RepID=UPI0037C6CABE
MPIVLTPLIPGFHPHSWHKLPFAVVAITQKPHVSPSTVVDLKGLQVQSRVLNGISRWDMVQSCGPVE